MGKTEGGHLGQEDGTKFCFRDLDTEEDAVGDVKRNLPKRDEKMGWSPNNRGRGRL